ncbi:MAG TPA: hypothetical protein VGL73_00600 [Caulobacteraceae bacterium]
MTSRYLTGAIAALSLVTAVAPATDAAAQFRHGGYDRGRGGRGFPAGAFIGGLALGSALGYYAGRPYYCRNHHHWRWSPYYHRYVYYYQGGYC